MPRDSSWNTARVCTPAESRERLLVVHRDRRDIELAIRLQRIDGLHGPVDDGQGLEAQEIELDEPGRLDVVLVQLGDEVRATFLAVERRKVGQFRRRDDDAAGVLARVAGQALERLREVDDRGDVLVLAVHAGELVFLLGQRLVQGHADFERDLLRDTVDETVRVAQHATGIADDGLRRHRAVGDDLRNPVATVAARDVVDDAVPALHAEIDIEIRHRHSLRIQEAFEQQVVLQRVEIGDAEHVGDQRACTGAASRAHRDVLLLGPANEVGDDQEVAGKSHVADDVEFFLEALAIRGRHRCRRAPATACPLRRFRVQDALETAGGFGAQEYSLVVWPSGTGNAGRNDSPRCRSRLQRRAISTVLSMASGISSNSDAISPGDFRYCCSL